MAGTTGFADFVDGTNVSLPEIKINSSEIFANAWQSLPPEVWQRVYLLMDIGKWVLIAILVYIIIKIIFQIMKISDSANIAAIAVNTKNINAKLDSLIHKKEKKEDKE